MQEFVRREMYHEAAAVQRNVCLYGHFLPPTRAPNTNTDSALHSRNSQTSVGWHERTQTRVLNQFAPLLACRSRRFRRARRRFLFLHSPSPNCNKHLLLLKGSFSSTAFSAVSISMLILTVFVYLCPCT